MYTGYESNKGEAEYHLQVGQQERLQRQTNIKEWRCKNKAGKPLEKGRSIPRKAGP